VKVKVRVNVKVRVEMNVRVMAAPFHCPLDPA